jgi:hypothetical protein
MNCDHRLFSSLQRRDRCCLAHRASSRISHRWQPEYPHAHPIWSGWSNCRTVLRSYPSLGPRHIHNCNVLAPFVSFAEKSVSGLGRRSLREDPHDRSPYACSNLPGGPGDQRRSPTNRSDFKIRRPPRVRSASPQEHARDSDARNSWDQAAPRLRSSKDRRRACFPS